jgi:hypothetical protein
MVFGTKEEEVAEGWNKHHYEKIHNFYILLNIFSATTTRKMRWAEQVARMVNMRKSRHIFIGCENGDEIFGSINAGIFFFSWVTVKFSKRTLLHGVT